MQNNVHEKRVMSHMNESCRTQKEQLERMLAEQRWSKMNSSSSASTFLPPRASRARAPKPVVKYVSAKDL